MTPRIQVREQLLDEFAATGLGALRYMRHWPSGPLSLVHLNVMTVLEIDGPLPMRVLAESLDVSQASATGIVDRMEQRGLVDRRRDDQDRRVVRASLTDEGRRLIAGLAAERRDHLTVILDDLSDAEMAALLTGVRAMRRARERLHGQDAGRSTSPTTPAPSEASR